MDTKLVVSNIINSVTPEDLRSLFSRAGLVKSVESIENYDRETGRVSALGLTYIVMSTYEEAQAAIKMFNGKNVHNCPIFVDFPLSEKNKAGIGIVDLFRNLIGGKNSAIIPPAETHPLRVFLCYSHSDALAVRGLYKRLTENNFDAWMDKEKLLPGSDWEYEIRRAVRASDAVVVCLSRSFNQQGFRQKEVRLALEVAMEQPEGEIFIIPARLEECENLESLRKWHCVDLFESDGHERLLYALRVRAKKGSAV
jgi:hypothetical protein